MKFGKLTISKYQWNSGKKLGIGWTTWGYPIIGLPFNIKICWKIKLLRFKSMDLS